MLGTGERHVGGSVSYVRERKKERKKRAFSAAVEKVESYLNTYMVINYIIIRMGIITTESINELMEISCRNDRNKSRIEAIEATQIKRLIFFFCY